MNMYHYKKAAIVLLFALLGMAAGATLSEKFSGTFTFVNQTLFAADGTPTYSYNTEPKRGGIFYVPAYPGALYGNMTALWGDVYPANATRTQILDHTMGYSGGYIITPDAGVVTHYPVVALAPTLLGATQVRYFSFSEGDNLLNLQVRSGSFLAGTLFWRRVFPLPTNDACSASIAITSQSSWVSNNLRHERVVLTVTNNGANPISTVDVNVALNGLTLESTSQVSLVSGTNYRAPTWNLQPGNSYSAGQFQVAGSGLYSIRLAATQCN